VVVALLLALFVAPTTPVGAAPPLRTLTVRGVPNAYTEVTFPTRMRLEVWYSSSTPPVFDTDGTYAGAYLEPVRGDGPAAGTAVLRSMTVRDEAAFTLGATGWVPAGRYRVYLLADAPATVRIRVAGLRRDMTLTTRTRADVKGGWVDRGVAGVHAPVDRTIVPFTVRPRTLTIAASQHESTGFYGRREECIRLRSDERSLCLEGTHGRGGYWGVYPATAYVGAGGSITAGTLRPGEYEVEFFDATVGVPHAYRTFLLTLN
jgi:hypothetical protein